MALSLWELGSRSSYWAAYSRETIDVGHNETPFLVCEGKCSGHRETWSTHKFASETYDGELRGFRQDYTCAICGHTRQFGLTEERITRRGERN